MLLSIELYSVVEYCGGLWTVVEGCAVPCTWLCVATLLLAHHLVRLVMLRSLPHDVMPFDEGIRKNLHYFCCASTRSYPKPWGIPDNVTDLNRNGFNWLNNEYYSCC